MIHKFVLPWLVLAGHRVRGKMSFSMSLWVEAFWETMGIGA